MDTRLVKITEENIELEIAKAGLLIKAGELVAFPTETVYGLGANALSKDASKKIYAAKGRPSDNPLIVHIAEFDKIEKIVMNLPKEAKLLADAFWPGPLTMRFKKNSVVPDETTGGLDTVAVRMPNNDIALAFIKAAGGYIAAPSANRSGRPSPTEASHVFDDMDGIIPLILDGGAVGIGIESTIVDLSDGDNISILRPGFITAKMIEDVIHKEVMLDPAVDGVSQDAHPKAPGMKYRHYAPKADLKIIEGTEEEVLKKMKELAITGATNGKTVGLMITEEHQEEFLKLNDKISDSSRLIVKILGSRGSEESIAHSLYKVLREFDDEQVDIIYSESVSHEGFGRAVFNRLLRAAGHQIIFTDKE